MHNYHYQYAKSKIKQKHRQNLSKLNYWARIERKFARKKRWKVAEFQLAFPHDIFASFVKDDELRIESIAAHYGYRVADERLLSSQSIYWFVKDESVNKE